MAFREVTMVEVKEVLRLWLLGRPKKAISRLAGVDRNTVRRYIKAALDVGVGPSLAVEDLGDEQVAAVMERLHGTAAPREHGESWAACMARRSFIGQKLGEGLLLSKVHRLLKRDGVEVPYATLHRYAVAEHGFGSRAATIPVADCAPGQEVQLDTGWMMLLDPDESGCRRRFKAWIFTSVCTRHRFVYPCLHETTASAIEACEAAWGYFGGVFHVVVVDNTKAIVQIADPTEPLVVQGFLEYAQARGFVVDPTRAGHPKDKARVERSVSTVREDCFRGERLRSVVDARERAVRWARDEYGMRRHSTTQRLPIEHFEAVEKACLLPAPVEAYDVPTWSDPKVGIDQLAAVARALYSLPFEYRRRKVRARVDRQTVRFYSKRRLIKVRPRQPPGGRDIDPNDFPPEKAATALRDVEFFVRKAKEYGDAVAYFARALLDGRQPWTRLRRVYALLGLCRRYGPERVNDACARANAVGMDSIKRLERMLKITAPAVVTSADRAQVVPIAKYLRPATQYALPFAAGGPEDHKPEGQNP